MKKEDDDSSENIYICACWICTLGCVCALGVLFLGVAIFHMSINAPDDSPIKKAMTLNTEESYRECSFERTHYTNFNRVQNALTLVEKEKGIKFERPNLIERHFTYPQVHSVCKKSGP